MSDCTIVVNNCKYTFKKFDLNEGKREISVEADNHKILLIVINIVQGEIVQWIN
ncbi:hypothetical protein RI030_16865 [Aphanizomenon flos-aquae NRERC-008]|uniref:hypothetical protein n=1 Tax=Aphanizomenon flos-aquae TaxID=1176 RepID=UPI00287E96E1|nr:hypothetical protein [Aphanizomenon flos-aquae]MDS9399222.1 hypothetical protein [Aphanizomenon flos-aquae NRERC-008]